jgi:hypothetical protein
MFHMDSLRLGELSVASKQAGVLFTFEGEEKQTITVLNNQIEALQSFLASHAAEDRRAGFRVPLQPLASSVRTSFKVTLSRDSKTEEVSPVDMSLTGVLVQVSDFTLNAGDHIVANLAFERDIVTLYANVVRQDQRLVALHFPSCVRDGELNPPAALLNIYRALELEWLKSRVPD